MNLLVLLALIAATAVGGDEAAVTTLDGRVISGTIAAWTAKEIAVNTANGESRPPTSTLLDVRWSREIADAPAALHVELIDGSRIPYAEFTVSNRKATFAGGRFKRPLSIPREAIRLIELRAPNAFIATALDEIERKELPGDALVVAQRDSETMDYLTGVIGDVTAEQALFEWDGERVPVKRSKIAAMVFYQARQQALPEVACELTLTDGSHLAASEASLRDGVVRVTTPAGVDLELPFDEIARADFSAGKIAYLSDLKPVEVRWTPGIGLPQDAAITSRYMPRSDSSFSGSPLSLAWTDEVARSQRDVRTYSKGLAVRSRTELTYRLPAGMKRFAAVAGLDPAELGQGHVLLEIRGDDNVLWEGAIHGNQAPMEIDVELGAARRLHLLVDYGENLDYGDRLHLVEARVTK